jgi:hypothetical protein
LRNAKLAIFLICLGDNKLHFDEMMLLMMMMKVMTALYLTNMLGGF